MRRLSAGLYLCLLGMLAAFPVIHAAPASPYPLTLTDDLGRRVTLKAPPQRIVSLAPSVTEMLFVLGLGQRVVGVTRWCTYPEAAKALPKVGDLALSEERIAALRPDLIVGDASLERPFLERLDRLGWPILAVAPRRVAEVPRAMELLARAAGKPEAGRREADRFRHRLERLVQAGAENARRPEGRARVFLLLDPEQLYTAGPGTFLDELVRLAGGCNVAAEAKSPWPLLSEEALLLSDPQVIVVACPPPAPVLQKPQWQGISAVRAGKVYQVDPDLLSRPGPRILDGLDFLISVMREQR
ncbi:MAG: helical backbone metal receptor [Bacillota bacterium]|nr:helical backbone metal receptor [Bacillota bacterium]